MPVDPQFQQTVRDQIAKAKAAGGTELDFINIKHPHPEATAWVLDQIHSQLPLLTTLHLWSNGIGEAGAVALARAIHSGKWNLKQLWLKGNDLSIDAAVLGSHDPVQIAAAILRGVVLSDARIMFLGMGRVGKTSLAHRCFVKDEPVADDPGKERTADFELVDLDDCDFKTRIEHKGGHHRDCPACVGLWRPAGTARAARDVSGRSSGGRAKRVRAGTGR